MDFQAFMNKIAAMPGGWGLVVQVFLIVFLALVIDLIQRIIMHKMAGKVRGTRNVWDDALFDSIRAPASAFIWLVGVSIAAELISKQTEAPVYEYVGQVREIGVITILTWFLLRLINHVEANVVELREKENKDFDRTATDAISKLLRASVGITAVLIAMQTLGFSVSGILAFGGVGGIAVGFAARDMLANFFGGMTVYLDKPFKVGDWVRSPDREIEGTVEHIGWRSTRIRTFEQRPLYVPNAVFTTITVENPSRMLNRRIYETIGVRYADFDRLEKIIKHVREMLEAHEEIDKTRTLMVNFNAYGASSLDFFVYTFTKTTVWAEYHRVKQDVLFRIGRIIEDEGAEIAFPTHTLHIPDGLAVNKPEQGAR